MLFENSPPLHEDAVSYQYWAFLSYASAHRDIAQQIQAQLEHLHLPRGLSKITQSPFAVPKKLSPIFLDRNELPCVPHLDNALKKHLTASRFLIVLFSAETLSSGWMDLEIRYFLSLGRRDRIIGILLDGGTPEAFQQYLQERMPDPTDSASKFSIPALGDLRTNHADWKMTVVRTASAMLGVSPAVFHKRDQAQSQTRKQFFASYVLRWQIPQGINQLDLASANRHSSFYCFHWKGGKLRRVEFLNGRRKLIPAMRDRAAVLILHYDENGRISKHEYQDAARQPVSIYTFAPDLLSCSRVLPASYGLASQWQSKSVTSDFLGYTPSSHYDFMLFSGKTEISRYQYHYAGDGCIEQETMHDTTGAAIMDEQGVNGWNYEYNEHGFLLSSSSLDSQEKPVLDNHGIASMRYVYDAMGECVEQSYHGADGRPVTGPYGYAIQRHQHKRSAKVFLSIHTSYHDASGSPCLLPSTGFASHKSITDGKGNYIEHQYFDAAGNLTNGHKGYAIMSGVCDARGNMVQSHHLDRDRKPVNDNVDGAAGWRAAYDKDGNQISWQQLRLNAHGVAEPSWPQTQMTYDAHSRLIARRFTDASGHPLLHARGYCSEHLFYNNHGALARREFRDANDKLMHPVSLRDEIEDGAIIEYGYTAYGSLASIRYRGPDERPSLGKLGFAEVRFAFDQRGFPTGTSYFGCQGEPVHMAGGMHRIVTQEDLEQMTQSVEFFDKQGQAVDIDKAALGVPQTELLWLAPPSFHKVTCQKHLQPAFTRFSFYSSNGRMTGPGWDYSTVELNTDIATHRRTFRFFDEHSRPCEPVASLVTQLDDHWRYETMSFFDAFGNPAEDNSHVSVKTFVYDAKGSPISTWLTLDGQEIVCLLYVMTVTPGSFADKAGIQIDDVVLKVGDWTIAHAPDRINPEALIRGAQASFAEGIPGRELWIVREGEPVRLVTDTSRELGIEWTFGLELRDEVLLAMANCKALT